VFSHSLNLCLLYTTELIFRS